MERLSMKEFPINEIERLILESVRQSTLFKNDWDGLLVSTILQMYLDKGEFSRFMEIHPFDRMDFEWYCRGVITEIVGEENTDIIVNNTFTEEDFKEEDYGDN